MADFICPEHGPFTVDPDARTTTPVEVVGVDEPGEPVSEVPTDDDGNPTATHKVVAKGPPVTVNVGVCPECGSPIVEAPPEYEQA